jgi:hypothetical protein
MLVDYGTLVIGTGKIKKMSVTTVVTLKVEGG